MRKLKVDYIPAETLWRTYWIDMGTARSLKKLSKWCANNGIVHPVTKKPPSDSGCQKAMARWAAKIENQELAYKILNEGLANNADFWTKEEFLEYVASKVTGAFQHKTDKKREMWLKRNGLK